ncbi:hypothetical protein vseg_015896 [Gypsophila vaccaria]
MEIVRIRRKKRVDAFESVPNKKGTTQFFKIYLPELNSNKLLIPPDFIEHFKGNIPKKIKLRNINGETWTTKTKVDEHNEKVFIRHGWETYARDHSLVRGDFLVFKHLQHSLFLVTVFGVDGCVKDEPLARHG